MANCSGDVQWGLLPSGCISRRQLDALKHTRRAAMQNSWIWGLLLALALCAALAFFLIEVSQIVESSMSVNGGVSRLLSPFEEAAGRKSPRSTAGVPANGSTRCAEPPAIVVAGGQLPSANFREEAFQR